MREIPVLVLLFVVSPGVANAQWLEVYGSAGPTVTDAGYSLAAGLGLSPVSRVTFVFGVDRTHLVSRIHMDGPRVVPKFRGGTLLLGTGEVQITPRGRGRLGPFGVAGLAIGVSHPNINVHFPERVTSDVRAAFFGGGLLVPLSERMNVIVDGRMTIGAEGLEGIVAVAPVRVGIGWRF